MGYSKVYALSRKNGIAICLLCVKAKRWDRAEIKHGGDPDNCMKHLERQYDSHMEACNTRNGTVVEPSQPNISSIFVEVPPTWTSTLVKWMIMTYHPLVVSCSNTRSYFLLFLSDFYSCIDSRILELV